MQNLRLALPLLALIFLTGCLSPVPTEKATPKQVIAELQSRGYVCVSRIPLGSKRSRTICKSPDQIEGENKRIGSNNNQIERDLADIQLKR